MKHFRKTLTQIIGIVATVVLVVATVPSWGSQRVFAEEAEGFPVYISAINPGYTVDGRSNVGEFIELATDADLPILLTGLSIRYTNTSGNRSTIYTFPDGSLMTGETLLLRLASAPEATAADATYTTQLALAAGPLELVYDGKVISSLCWTGSEGCYKKFVSGSGMMLVWNYEEEIYKQTTDYEPWYDTENPSLVLAKPVVEPKEPHCQGLELSELFTYYETDASEQFVEIYNRSDETVDLGWCRLRYKTTEIQLNGLLGADSYYARYATDFKMTKNPTKENTVALTEADGAVVDELKYLHGQKKGVAYAQFEHNAGGAENWQQTYALTPGEPNVYQQYRTCEDGKVLNEATGNCVKVAQKKTAEPCPAGKYRNPLTGRCKSYAKDKAQKPCAEGYERNPETNRCRKVKNNNGAGYGLEPTEDTGEVNFVALGIIVGIGALAVGYVGWQFRGEIAGGVRKVTGKVAGKIRRGKGG